MTFSFSFAGLRSLHIHNATLEFRGGANKFVTHHLGTCSTLRFSNIKFVFTMSAFSRREG
jgi:hypothetical protein